MRFAVLAAVALGGACGSLARYGIDESLPTGAGDRGLTAGFPWATLTVNLVGCFLLGAVMVVLLASARPTPYLRPFLTSGVLGGFTTYSTFAVESRGLLAGGHAGIGAAYIVVSMVGCLAAGAVGLIAARSLVDRRPA